MNDADKIVVVFVHEKLQMVTTKRLKFAPRTGDIVDIFVQPMPVVSKVILCPRESRIEDLKKITGAYIPHIVDTIVFLE